jgi:hypothetical protein
LQCNWGMGRALVRIGAVIGVVSLGSGCGGGASNPAPPADQFAAKYLAALCQKLISCCTSAQLTAIFPGIVDVPSCEAALAPSPQSVLALGPGLVAAGGATYDTAAAQGCLAELAALPCGASTPSALAQCGQVFQGTLAAGGPCSVGVECSSDFCTNASGGVSTCAAPVGAGQSCEFAPCSSGLACVFSQSGGPRTCGTPLPDGSACMSNADCAGGSCAGVNSNGIGTCGPTPLCGS